MAEKFVTGRDCDAWCTKCKLDLAHTIVAMVSGQPVQVKCNTCGGFHKYRAPASARGAKRTRAPAGAKKKTTRAPRGAAAVAAGNAAAFEADIARLAGKEARTYNIRDTYEPDEIVDHPKFGRGVVKGGAERNRVKVMFRDGERTLISGFGAGD